ncbi:hypothetical protein DYB34_005665 [Aphanomyces astaci]|uniref:Rap-GAP domain-containing protein n=3 Tax=Aphanomyces astaci TaxID=112090 RepID=A0A3R6VLA5_APHAT|nr:hypothetical protein DYB34_005665 [Aphanomyces astaci]
MHRAIIAHVSQVFHPSVHFDDANIFIVGVDLLELLSQQPLHIHSFAVLRKAILATTDASFFLRDTPPGPSILVPMVAAVFHTWMHGMVQPNGASVDVWAELGTMVRKWLTHPSVSAAFAAELVRRWKVEVTAISALVQWFYTPPPSGSSDKVPPPTTDHHFHHAKDVALTSTFVAQQVAPTVDAALIVLDRLLHVMSPSATLSSLKPHLLLAVQTSVRDIVSHWVLHAPALGISPSTILCLFGEWFLPSCEMPMSRDFDAAQAIALETLCLVCTAKGRDVLLPPHVAMFCRVLHAALQDTTNIRVLSTVIRHASTVFGRCAPGIHVLVPAFLHAIDALTLFYTSLSSSGGSSSSEADCLACVELLFGMLALPGQYPHVVHESWRAKLHDVASTHGRVGSGDTVLPHLAEFDVERLVDLEQDRPHQTTSTQVRQRALWGVYLLVVLQLHSVPTPDQGSLLHPLVKTLVIYLCDTCASRDVALSQTSLAAVHALHVYHATLLRHEPGLVQHIVMALSLLVQQQVEDASTVIRDHLEGSPPMDYHQMAPPLHFQGQRGHNGSPTNHPPQDMTPPISRGRKRSNSWSAPDKPSGSDIPSNQSKQQQSGDGLQTIANKSRAIFEGLTDWLMRCTSLLDDPAVLKLLFQALEAALIGSIPTTSEWQTAVEDARKRKRNMDTPLLFLGLAMRVSLDPDRHKTSLQLHHLHGFPSPAGIDQFVSTCTEFDDKANDNVTSLSFVYLNSLVLTVVGSVDAATARIVVRDVTGTFTWDAVVMPGVSAEHPVSHHHVVPPIPSVEAPTRLDQVQQPWDRPLVSEHDRRERLEVVMDHAVVHANMPPVPASNMCSICGGRVVPTSSSSISNVAPTPPSPPTLLPFPVANKVVVKGNTLPSMPRYMFHSESHPGLTAPGSNFDVYVCQCRATFGTSVPDDSRSTSSTADASDDKAPPLPICDLFTIDADHEYIGSLDHERSLLELLVDSIPMQYRDCGGDLIDKTLLGGRYTMQRYLDMEWDERRTRSRVGPMHKDASAEPGFSFFQRLVHDDECYAYLKSFLAEDKDPRGRYLVEFWYCVAKSIDRFIGVLNTTVYERSFDGNDRLSQASLLYWEYLSSESNFSVKFPYGIASKVQQAIQVAASKDASTSRPPQQQQVLPLTLFQPALDVVEATLGFDDGNGRGLLDRFIVSLNDHLARKQLPSHPDGGDAWTTNVPIPHQLLLYDAFNVMELNVRICAETLHVKASTTTNTLLHPKATAALSAPSPSTTRLAPLDMCRLFLGHVGILPNDVVASHHDVQLLDNGVKLERSLKHLDKAPSRETMKIGVVYVGPNQSTQTEILGNDRGSPAYERFLRQMGWEVDLSTHRGFVGGLDVNPKSLSNGATALYFATSTAELIFHVVTMMPTREADPQQIDKKRHVGNDYVHVVWSDNLLVLFPLQHPTYDGLVLVEVLTKPNTVMNANRACRQQTQWYMAPYTTRRKLIEEVIERYAMPYSEKSMLTSLFKIPSSPSEGHSL